MDIRKLTGSKTIAAVEFGGIEPTLTIVSAEIEEFIDEDKNVERKGVVKFKELPGRIWIINVTNAQLVAAMFGRETKNWIGKRVTLYAAPSKAQFAIAGVAIRVRGSPDIEKDIVCEVKLARKAPKQFTLTKTGAK